MNTPMFEASKRQTVSNAQSKFIHVDTFPYFAHRNLRRTRIIFSKKYEFGGSDSNVVEDSRLKGSCPVVLVCNLNPSNSAVITSNFTYLNENTVYRVTEEKKIYILRKKSSYQNVSNFHVYQNKSV
jgi:hypothetical protein